MDRLFYPIIVSYNTVMKSKGQWLGRECSRPRKDDKRRYVPTRECTGGEGGVPCLSCRLKMAWNGLPDGRPFDVRKYVYRNKHYGESEFVGMVEKYGLVKDRDGVPTYNGAPWIIRVLLCDYLDKLGYLSWVQPPVGYIRNPACVHRDEMEECMKRIRIENQHLHMGQ